MYVRYRYIYVLPCCNKHGGVFMYKYMYRIQMGIRNLAIGHLVLPSWEGKAIPCFDVKSYMEAAGQHIYISFTGDFLKYRITAPQSIKCQSTACPSVRARMHFSLKQHTKRVTAPDTGHSLSVRSEELPRGDRPNLRAEKRAPRVPSAAMTFKLGNSRARLSQVPIASSHSRFSASA